MGDLKPNFAQTLGHAFHGECLGLGSNLPAVGALFDSARAENPENPAKMVTFRELFQEVLSFLSQSSLRILGQRFHEE